MMMPRYEIKQGDVLDFCREYEGEKFHAMICDPPYHLTSIVNRFKNGEPEHTKTAPDIKHRRTPHARQAAGFMGKQWDGGDIAFQPETWAAFGTLLHPGAFCMAFAGTRGYHRMAVAIEDAGFILHPMMCWIFGSGFPKATRILNGDYEETGETRNGAGSPNTEALGPFASRYPATLPATPSAKAWQNHRYGLQALKPALEPICVFQKPYKGKPVDCITKTGAGALNIGRGRIETSDKWSGNVVNAHENYSAEVYGAYAKQYAKPSHEAGRWPSNLLLDEETAERLDRQSGVLTSGARAGANPNATESLANAYDGGWKHTGGACNSSSGGASRFFMKSDWQAEEYDPFFPFRYEAKAGRAERDAGLERMPLRPKQGHIRQSEGRKMHGDTETFPCRNPHPTVKPLRLTHYLASLLLPPAEYAPRRILVPFAGVASEMIGAHLAGWEDIVGIEGEAEYCEIGEARLKFWSGNSGLFESLTEEDEVETAAQEILQF